jgi:hypothetical protein
MGILMHVLFAVGFYIRVSSIGGIVSLEILRGSLLQEMAVDQLLTGAKSWVASSTAFCAVDVSHF